MQCRILFHDNNLQQFDWCKIDDSTDGEFESGVSTSDQLKKVTNGCQRITVLLPQQDIQLAVPQLPARASKQQLNAIAYTIEESLAQDIDDCFFAIAAQQADQSVPVAVIDKDVMDKCVALFSSQHINIHSILPPVYLCPWQEDETLLATICSFQDRYLIRHGLHKGFVCGSRILKPVLNQVLKQRTSAQNRLEIYADEGLQELEEEGIVVKQHASLQLLAGAIEPQSCINLKQKEYQSTYQWVELLKQWKLPVAAMGLLIMVMLAATLVNGWKKQQIYRDLITQQQTLLSTHLPGTEPGDNPKKQLIKVLTESGSSKGQTGFIDLLHEYATLKADFQAVNTNKIQFQQSRLAIDLETADLKSLESFRTRLADSQFQAEIENVNISPDKTTGRLVMREP